MYWLPQILEEGQYQNENARIKKSQTHKIQGIPVAIRSSSLSKNVKIN